MNTHNQKNQHIAVIDDFILENFGVELLKIKNHSSTLSHAIHMQEKYLLEVLCRLNHLQIKRAVKLGDFHNNQKCTLLLTGSDAKKYIYKPTSPISVKIFNMLVGHYSEGFDFKKIHIKQEWADAFLYEYVAEDVESKIDNQNYSYHFGALTLFAYLFKISDLHHENIIATQSSPLIIDTETICYPHIQGLKSFSFESSLLLPSIHNPTPSIAKYGKIEKEFFTKGVRQLCTNIENNKEPGFLTHLFPLLKTRVILKPTQYYQTIIKNIITSSFIKDDLKIKAYLDECIRGEHPISKATYGYELKSLAQLDVPYFYFSNNCIFNGNEQVITLQANGFSIKSAMKNVTQIALELLAHVDQANSKYLFFSSKA